jgi:signal transduction histidine kinase
MRFFIGIALFLAVQSTCFAQFAALSSSAKTKQEKTIDRLNNIAYDTYLQAPDSARFVAEKALLLSEKAKYQSGIGHSFLNIGHIYWSQSYYPIALFYLNKALVNLPKNEPLAISNCYNIMGRTYTDLKDYKDAITSLDKSEHFAGNDPASLAGVYSERSLVYKRTGKYDEAILNVNKALKLNRLAHADGSVAIMYGRLAGIYKLKKEYKAALAYSDTSLKLSFTTHNNRLRATTYVDYGFIYYYLKDYNKAIAYANKGGDLADSIGVVDAIFSAYKVLIAGYEAKNDLKQVIACQKRYTAAQDSLSRFTERKNAELIQSYFAVNSRLNEMAAEERNDAIMKSQMKWQNMVINTLTLSLLAVIALLLVTYYFFKQKKLLSERLNMQNEALTRQKLVIEAQTTNLETLSSVKDKLLAVIAHDLRTPLANLRNMADMFEMDYLTNEEIHQLMKDINPMVKSAELTLSNLLDWAGNQIKGQSINLTQLDIFLMGVEMEQTFNHALQKKGISFVNGASPGRSVTADENHIKVVLRNLISNAIKFTGDNGTIKLASEYQDDTVIISVEDTGKGMTEEEMGRLFSAKTHFSSRGTSGENGLGIGLMLCKELIELNGGKLWIQSLPGTGSTFYFSLPLNAEYA